MQASIYRAFENHDRDRSGQIDLAELSSALRELGYTHTHTHTHKHTQTHTNTHTHRVEATAEQARSMLKIADIDASGTIDKREFYRLIMSVMDAGDKFDIIMRDKGAHSPKYSL